MAVKVILVALSLLCLVEASVNCTYKTKERTVIATRHGRIRGTIEKTIPDGRPFYAFRGIPYVKPAVGILRMQDPVPYGRWEVPILNATAFRPACPQYNFQHRTVIGDEDCLYLNVYTPRIPRHVHKEFDEEYADDDGDFTGSSKVSDSSEFTDSSEFSDSSEYRDFSEDSDTIEESNSKYRPKPRPFGGLPVMVWFHGGGYVIGGSQDYGPEFLLREDIVLVTVNYRLGALGFLSTGDDALPGNYAMLDMVEALKWVRQTITHFGGNPHRVTISGMSVGAGITHMLSLSPLAKGLIHNVISQSGAGICDWTIDANPLTYTRKLANRLNCTADDNFAMVACIKTKDPRDLVLASVDLDRYSLLPALPAPVVDKATRAEPFLPDTPMNLIKKRKYHPVPMMTGVVKNEGVFFLAWVLYENLGRISSPWFIEKSLLPGVLDSVMKNGANFDAVVKAVKDRYFNGIDFKDFNAVLPRLTQAVGDLIFTSCAYETQLLHAKRSPVYAYVFDYPGEKTPIYVSYFIDIVRRAGIDPAIFREGASHADDIFYLFNIPRPDVAYSPADMEMSQRMTKLWANFVTYGTPTPHHEPHEHWPEQTYHPYPPAPGHHYPYPHRPPYRQLEPQQERHDPHHHPVWYPVPADTLDVPYFNISANEMCSGFRKEEFKFWKKDVRRIRNSNNSTVTSVPQQSDPPCYWEWCY